MTRRQLLLSTTLSPFLACTAQGKLAAGSKLPDLGTFGLEGELPNLKGKVVYLDFWASWCAPCKASFPVLNAWQQEFAAKGFTVLAVSVDDDAKAMADFLSKNKVAFPTVRDAAHKLVAFADVTTMPTSLLIDRVGNIRLIHNGFRGKDAAKLHTEIATLVG
jgi:thiol-disulfide isomerase/thioredoxin